MSHRLDDYHVLDARPVDDALAFLVEHLPPQVHLVIATREDPALPLARLRARGQLTELRGTDLRFTPDEAAAFLSEVMGLDLSAEQVRPRADRGWIAGLQLAAISLQGREACRLIASFAGSTTICPRLPGRRRSSSGSPNRAGLPAAHVHPRSAVRPAL
jgi:LuxR family maltose regulon positive regulatory protein